MAAKKKTPDVVDETPPKKRRKAAPVAQLPLAASPPAPVTETRVSVARVTTTVMEIPGAVRLVTLPPTDPMWLGHFDRVGEQVRGLFVRLVPPADSTDEQVREVIRQVKQHAAFAVRTVPKLRAAVLPSGAVNDARPAERKSARAVVTELLAEANTDQRGRLEAIVEEALGKAGL